MQKLCLWKKSLSLTFLMLLCVMGVNNTSIATASTASSKANQPELKTKKASPHRGDTLLARRCNSREMRISTPNRGRLNIRASNNPNARIVATLPNGSAVWRNGWDQSGQWADISYPGNIRGWVWANYLTCPN